MAKTEKRQILDPRLAAGIHAMLDGGFEPEEVARRTVRLIIQLAGQKYVDAFRLRKHTLSHVLTPERLRLRQAEIEAEWGGPQTKRRVKDSLADMAEWADGDPRPPGGRVNSS